VSPATRLALLLGLALFSAVLVWEGAGSVIAAVSAVGWALVPIVAFHLLPLWLDGAGLWVLPAMPRSFAGVLHARWIGESVNCLLPVAGIGGEVVRARLLARQGTAPAPAAAGVIAALTLQCAGQGVFALLGIALLVGAGEPRLLLVLLAAVLGFGTLIGMFYRAQRSGLITRLARRFAPHYGADGVDLDHALAAAYADRRAVASSFALHLAAWIVGFGEVWLTLHFMGQDVSVREALILESLGQAVRGAAFAIPGALGVQEGGYLFLGVLLGVPASATLGLSLVKRVRELALGLPGLAAWQAIEGRALLRAKSPS
jgi:putative membrane protein